MLEMDLLSSSWVLIWSCLPKFCLPLSTLLSTKLFSAVISCLSDLIFVCKFDQKRLNNYQRDRLMVFVSLGVDVVLQIHFDLVVHLCINIDAAETRNDAHNAETQTGECNKPAE